MTILPIDEINALGEKIKPHFDEDGKIKSREDAEDIIEEMLELFTLSYARGANATNAELGTKKMPPTDDMDMAIYMMIAGKMWDERVMEYYENGGSVYDIQRIAETDATRIYNQGALDAVKANGSGAGVNKRWATMNDDRVRDTHSYLEGMVVPYNAEFYTYDGDHAAAPGMFSLPENNINCRCVVEVIRG